jgi:hypothetical protein
MDRGGKPELRDWMGLAQGFRGIAHDARNARVQDQQMQIQSEQHEMDKTVFAQKQQQQKQADQQQAEEAQLKNVFYTHLDRGGDPSQLNQLVPEGVDPVALNKARIDAMAYAQDKQAYSQKAKEAKAQQWEMDRRAGMALVQKADAALAAGDMQTFNDLMATAYNTVIYDGQRIVDRKDKKGQEVVEFETVDGKRHEMINDLAPEQQLAFVAKSLQNPEEYINQRLAADKGRRKMNAEYAKNPEPFKGEDGKTYWGVLQVNPATDRPHMVIYAQNPLVNPESPPISVNEDGQRYFDKKALELEEQYGEATGKGAAGQKVDPLNKNQALGKLKDYYFESGPMGELRARMNSGQEKYQVAEEKFNELVSQENMAAHEAAIASRQFVEQIEADYFDALKKYPDHQEELSSQFAAQYGYVPKKGTRQ